MPPGFQIRSQATGILISGFIAKPLRFIEIIAQAASLFIVLPSQFVGERFEHLIDVSFRYRIHAHCTKLVVFSGGGTKRPCPRADTTALRSSSSSSRPFHARAGAATRSRICSLGQNEIPPGVHTLSIPEAPRLRGGNPDPFNFNFP